MTHRRFRFLTLAPCVALGLLFLSPKATGILSAAIMVGVLITIHELGHFLVARWMGAPVDVFSIGFGPRLLGFKWKETDVRLSAVPLGGYVRLAGETSEVGTGPAEGTPEADVLTNTFFTKPYYQRMLFYTGGILANLATAFVIFVGLGLEDVRVVKVTPPPVVVASVEGAAAEAGLRAGDVLLSIDELAFPSTDWNTTAVSRIQGSAGKPMVFCVDRQGKRVELTITPRLSGKVGMAGIRPVKSSPVVELRPFQFADIGRAFGAGMRTSWQVMVAVTKGYWMLFTGQISPKHVSGPAGIVSMGSEAAQAGLAVFLSFTAFLSINLAVLNAIPIPGLDGSHAVILTIERIRRKDLPIALKEKILMTGFYLMLTLLVVLLVKDFFFKH